MILLTSCGGISFYVHNIHPRCHVWGCCIKWMYILVFGNEKYLFSTLKLSLSKKLIWYLLSFFMSEKLQTQINFLESQFQYYTIRTQLCRWQRFVSSFSASYRKIGFYLCRIYVLCINGVTYFIQCYACCARRLRWANSANHLSNLVSIPIPKRNIILLLHIYSTNGTTCPLGFCMSNLKMPDFFMDNNFSYHYY